jgi:hypothetical protein
MTGMRNLKTVVVVTALAAASTSCGDVVRQGKSSVFLVIDSLQGQRGGATGSFGNPLLSDVLTIKTSPAPCSTTEPCPTFFNDLGQVAMHVAPKNVTLPAGPSANNEVTIKRFHVVYKRADGRNTPGVDVPWPFDGAVTVTLTSSTSTFAFEIVRHVAKQEAPLAALVYAPQVLTTIADVTFYGADRVGNEISVTGSIQIDFANFGDF